MKTAKRTKVVKPESSAREIAYNHIQHQIASRTLSAGSALSELGLSRELGISRTPIREAIGQLASEGLLEQTPNRGTVVAQLTRRDIVELYELREALEVFAVAKTAGQQVRPSDLDRLRQFADKIVALRDELKKNSQARLSGEQMHRFMNCDLAFHTLLMRLAANSRMLKVVNETRLLIRIFAIQRHGHDRGELERISKEHHAVADALAGGDAPLAVKLLAQHIQRSRQERLEEFDGWEHDEALRETQISVSSLSVFAEES